MHKVKAFIILIRLPNLIFIVLTQLLVWFSLIRPLVIKQHLHHLVLNEGLLLLLALSTMLIAAAGYMINDYFDIGIDAINKPQRVTIEKVFKRRTIIVWHVVLNILALLMAAYISLYYLQLRYLVLQFISIFLLLVYSTTFKRKLLIGNLTISFLTALSLLSVAIYEPGFPLSDVSLYTVRIYWTYILFAFLITFSREVIKDIEDIKGDDTQYCKTIPLVWGIQTAKNFVYALIVSLLMILVVVCVFQKDMHFTVTGSTCLLLLSLLYVVYKIQQATKTIHFHKISIYLKWITLVGILSMICYSDINTSF